MAQAQGVTVLPSQDYNFKKEETLEGNNDESNEEMELQIPTVAQSSENLSLSRSASTKTAKTTDNLVMQDTPGIKASATHQSQAVQNKEHLTIVPIHESEVEEAMESDIDMDVPVPIGSCVVVCPPKSKMPKLTSSIIEDRERSTDSELEITLVPC